MTLDFAPNLAIYVDYENVAIGARDAKFDDFDIRLVLERLLDKGKIVVKKAYSDWERYKTARKPLHEAGFEMIEIPHVSYSGKNSADIRLVVDALDLCYTKQHVDVFVVVSGDSDFSPLVGKLRENNKKVIGLGVKSSTSELLVGSCDEFIYYDDLVRQARAHERSHGREREREPKRPAPAPPPAPPRSEKAEAPAASAPAGASGDAAGKEDEETRKRAALDMVLDTVDALFRDRDDALWGSMVKQTLKRKRPNFDETFHGYRTFNQLLEDAERRGLLELQKDAKSGGYVVLAFGGNA
jgi:uncharacterized protein (TIGR00288 family)